MIKLSHYVAIKLADWGVRHVFLIPGGGASERFLRQGATHPLFLQSS